MGERSGKFECDPHLRGVFKRFKKLTDIKNSTTQIKNKIRCPQDNIIRPPQGKILNDKEKVPQRLLVNTQSDMCVTTILPIHKSALSTFLPESWNVLSAK